ncbi:nucleotide exchange factor GrpE [Nocardioidaceae bacterium]|nr:nucleotide exchange factor GrpE [Nocardioidaceae bacterium]
MAHPDTATGPSGDPLAEAVDAASAGGSGADAQSAAPDAAEAPVVDPGAPAPDEDGGIDELVAAHDRIAGLTGDLQRLQAEYVNYKRRVDRDREANKQQATVAAATALLPVLDDIDRAREHGEVVGGFKHVADSLVRVVGQLGLERFGEPGEEFDPTLHEAISQRTSDDVTTTTVEHVAQAGYRAGDRVVRAAMVVVVSPG